MPKIPSEKEPPSAITKLFPNNKIRAVRLAKAVDFDANVSQVRVLKFGNGRLIVPAERTWSEFFESDGLSLPPDEPDAS